jgi:hypothetical protein
MPGCRVASHESADIEALIETMQQGSLKIHDSACGTPGATLHRQEVANLRIMQKCLPNAPKHGGRGPGCRGHFDWSGSGLTLHMVSTMAPD